MNKELIEKLTRSSEKLLEFTEKTGETTVDFAKEQVPLIIQEFLNWGLYSHIVYASISLLFFIVASIFLYKSMKHAEANNWNDERNILPILLSVIFLIPISISFIINLTCIIKILVAPRMYLIEELHKLVK